MAMMPSKDSLPITTASGRSHLTSRWCLTSEAGGWLLVSKNDSGYCSNSMANWQLVEDEDARLQKTSACKEKVKEINTTPLTQAHQKE